MSSSLELGCLAYGKSGACGIVITLAADHVVLRFASGDRPVAYEAITHWEAPIWRVDSQGIRWTYLRSIDTLAVYLGAEGRRHRVRPPGGSTRTVSTNELLDPLSETSGGPARWPCLLN